MCEALRPALVAAVLGLLLTGPAPAQPLPEKPAAAMPDSAATEPPHPAQEPGAPQAAPPPPADPIAAAILHGAADVPAKITERERAERTELAAFYAARSGEPLWLSDGRLSRRAELTAAEIRRADDWGLRAADFDLPAFGKREAAASPSPEDAAGSELKMSLAVLKYARHARGGRMDPTQLSYSIDRAPPLLEPKTVLEGIAAAAEPGAYLRGLHPRHSQFEKLRQLLLAMRSGRMPQAAPPFEEPASGKSQKKKSAPAPEVASVRRVLLNMEQWRWMPETLGDMYVWVNIPEFTLRVVKGGKVVHAERVVTGKPDTQTPIFSDEMETIVFHPFWGVPDSIKVKEILPSLLRGGSVLERHNLRAQYRGREIDAYSVDWSRVNIRNVHIYQPPGGSNVLGVVKFLFPNAHQVYLHDTPTKNLFAATQRAFSHGCIRVRNPLRLAEVLLAEDKGWPASRIAQLVSGGPQNNNITLDRKVPVHITYFTALVDEDGKPDFRSDIYGHEERIQMGVDGKAHLIVKKKENLQAEVVSRLNETSPWGGPNWMRNIFGGF